MELTLGIDAWSAWSSSRTSRSEWLSWAKGEDFESASNMPDVSMVPALKRRRMSSLSRMAFATAMDCLGECADMPVCVFATRHGELARTVDIVESMILGNDISPTSFGLSVHNTAQGLFSILSGNKQPATTVVGGVDTFCSALLESAIHIKRFPESPVLMVYFDEPMADPLSALELGPPEAISIALLLRENGQARISLERNYYSEKHADDCARPAEKVSLGEEFLGFFLAEERQRDVRVGETIWSWGRL